MPHDHDPIEAEKEHPEPERASHDGEGDDDADGAPPRDRTDWTPRLKRQPTSDRARRTTFRMRVEAGLGAQQRMAGHLEHERLLHRLADIDDAMASATSDRLAALDAISAIRDELWPVVKWCKGRRPPIANGAPLPPAAPNAEPLGGWVLRYACLQILQRHGRLPLVQIHAWLHRYGYLVAGDNPVKALADALGHEHDGGRAVRISRGVYELAPDIDGPLPGPISWNNPPAPDEEPRKVEYPIVDPLTDPPRRAGRPESRAEAGGAERSDSPPMPPRGNPAGSDDTLAALAVAATNLTTEPAQSGWYSRAGRSGLRPGHRQSPLTRSPDDRRSERRPTSGEAERPRSAKVPRPQGRGTSTDQM